MMLDMLPIESFAGERAVRMDINFQRECRYGQTLTIGHERRDACDLFEISAEGARPCGLRWSGDRRPFGFGIGFAPEQGVKTDNLY